ncbi:MAG: hypothetical protein H6624_13775 [Bdellovibrionaceae bacterium]|nr:hypothetical protein [Bdellovibrionales bacterium]MCB9085409.1 hypothetical protein [Pseudobdellovibrionaceae bacterium]
MRTTKKRRLIHLSNWPMVTIVFLAIQLWSNDIAFVDSRPLPRKALVIQQSPVSPSWAAYEDVRASEQSEIDNNEDVIPKEQGDTLLAGQESMSMEKWLPEKQPPAHLYPSLNGMIISQRIQGEIRQVSEARTPNQDAPTLPVAPADQPPVFVTSQGVEVNQLEVDKMLVAASDPEAMSFEQRAQELVQEELRRRQEQANQPKVRTVPTADGGQIIVAAPPRESSTSAAATAESNSGAGQKVAVNNKPPSSLEPPSVSLIEQSIDDRDQKFVLSGIFRVSEGLAYVPGAMRFELIHYQYDVAVAQGNLWEDQARFEIVVPELKGRLVLRLVDIEQNIIGSSEILLQSLPLPARNQQSIADLQLKLKPVPIGATAEVVSAYSMGNQAAIPVPRAEVAIEGLNRFHQSNEDGEVDDPDMLPGSSFLLRAKRKAYWGSLAVGLSGKKRTLELFPDRLIEALLGLVARSESEQKELRQKGIIWGRVVKGGEPVEGAVIELAGEYGISPVYLNEIYLPDQNMEGTGRNGLFAFVGVADGIQSVRAIVNGVHYPAKVIPVEGQYVSNLELEVGHSTTAMLKVTSAPKREAAEAATFRIIGTDLEYRVNGEAIVQWPKGSGLMLLEAEGGEQMDVIRMSLDRGVTEVKVPLIPSEWLQQLAIDKRVNLEGQKGVVVGFVNGKDFEVFLDEKESYPLENIVYFDKDGLIVRDKKGVAGGGFVLFNTPTGFKSVNIVPSGSDKILTRTIITEPAVTNVIPEVSL